MKRAAIRAVEYYLPEKTLTNEQLHAEFPQWPPEKILAKTGIACRHIAADDEAVSDMAVRACEALFDAGACDRGEVDFLIVCTQSPDYRMPSTACLVQDRLGLGMTTGALDVNLGCSGWVYSLSLARGLIETEAARRVLIVTGETYSRFMDPHDFGSRSIFGDGAAATLVEAVDDGASGGQPWLGPFVFGTDGRGVERIIVRRHSLVAPEKQVSQAGSVPHSSIQNADGTERDPEAFFMDGPEVFSFTLRTVPGTVKSLLDRAGVSQDEIDLFLFHQANKFMLEHLRRKLKIPAERFVYAIEDCANTVSSTIPIALARAVREGRVAPGARMMLVAFGVGYSWGAALARWPGR